jgi:hypothetical protein
VRHPDHLARVLHGREQVLGELARRPRHRADVAEHHGDGPRDPLVAAVRRHLLRREADDRARREPEALDGGGPHGVGHDEVGAGRAAGDRRDGGRGRRHDRLRHERRRFVGGGGEPHERREDDDDGPGTATGHGTSDGRDLRKAGPRRGGVRAAILGVGPDRR